MASQVHDCFVYKLGTLLGSVGHKVKIHKITSEIVQERGDIEMKDYLVLQKPHPIGQLTHTSVCCSRYNVCCTHCAATDTCNGGVSSTSSCTVIPLSSEKELSCTCNPVA